MSTWETSGSNEQSGKHFELHKSCPCECELMLISPCSASSKIIWLLLEELSTAEVLSSFETSHRHLPNTEDNMDVKNVIKSQGNVSCPRDLPEDGDDLLHFTGVVDVSAGRAEGHCSTQVPSHPTGVTTWHTDHCGLGTEHSGSGHSLADGQGCKETGLGTPLTTNSLLSEQADSPRGNPTYFVKDESANSASVLEISTEKVPSVSGDFSDDDLEYFECSDVLTAHEDEIWKKKLQFLLESDDEDDLKLSKDCDGCAYFLSETPCVFRVSDNTTPMDTPIGFCGHHSKFKGVNVRRDPSMYSQSPLQADMTLTVGHHRDKSTNLKDQDKSKVPVASAATGNEHPSSAEEIDGSGHAAAGFSAGKAKPTEPVPAEAASGIREAPGTMTEPGTEGDALGEGSLQLGEGSLLRGEQGRNVPEENAQLSVCTFTESLRRNFFKLLNPVELCRYVSAIGQSLQAAAEGKESSAPSPRQEGVLSAGIPEETESLHMQAGLCQTEEADKDCHWERERTRGLSEQSQMPDEDGSLGNQGAYLRSVTQDCENLCMEPKREKEGTFRACESAGTSQPAAEMLSTENTLQAKNADLQTSLHCAPWGKREDYHQQVGQEITSNGNKPESDISTFPLLGTDSVPDKQECLCAVLSSANLCEELGQGEQRSGCDLHDSSDPDILYLQTEDEPVLEADPKAALESGEPACRGDADVSAERDELWKLLHEGDSDCQTPLEDRGITSLEMKPTESKATELGIVQETCCDHPLPMDLMEEQEPVPDPASSPGTEKAGCTASDTLLQGAGACQGASTGDICLAQVLGTDGVCLESSAGNETGPPSICTAANRTPLSPGQCLQPPRGGEDSSGYAVAWEGKLLVNGASQTCGEESPQRLQNAQRGNSACPEANPAYLSDTSHGTAGQLLHTEHKVSLAKESIAGEGCRFRDCYPLRGELAYFPEEEGIFYSQNTCQLTHAEHSSVNTTHKSYEANLQGKGNHSDLNAQNDTNSGSCHLSKNNDCQDFQVVSNAEKYGYVMHLPTLIKTQEIVTHKSLPQNTDQLIEIAKQDYETPSSKDPFLRDFCLEVPSCEPCKAEREQREIGTADESRAETSRDSGVSQVSESQTAVSPHYTAEQHVFFVDSTFESDEQLKIDSSKYPTCAFLSVTSASAPLPRKAQSELHSTAGGKDPGTGDQLDSQQLTGKEMLPFLTSVSHSQGLLPSVAAVACPGTGSRVKTVTTPTGVKGNRNLSGLETSCKTLGHQFQRVPGETKGGAALGENERGSPRAVECNADETETNAPLHTFITSQVQRQVMNTSTEQSCPNLIPSSRITEADNSVKSTEYNKEEEVRTAENVINGLGNLPAVDSGRNQCFQEQPPCSRTQPFSLALTTCDPFPGNAERQRNQEGSQSCQTPRASAEPEPIRGKQDTAKCGHLAAGAKKKLPPATLSKKPRLEERGGVSKDPSCVRKSGKSEVGGIHKEDRKEQRKLILKKDSKAPRLLKKIQAELFPDCSGNVKLCCQFGDIHGDSTITWTKDSKILAQLQRRMQDDSPVSLEIAKATNKDQGMYYCCLNNKYGKVTAEFHLTAAVLERLSSFQNYEGVEEIEFMQLLFREDSLSDSYFGGHLHGVLATEERHFGEGMHRRAFRSRVRRGLAPVFAPGHPCVLKVHSAVTCGTGSAEELVQRNYSLALQECCVQNAAREYAKLYAAEAETLEGFGEVPEIIPIFLIHRPANKIPYATVEEELVGEFVKYSVRDGKEVNFLRRDSEAGQKCCTFQHWVYEKTSGNLLVTDLQGVGMKLTDVGIATLAKGYKGFKGNCSFSFIEQFRALHQCNVYCEMLGLKALRTTHQKQRKATPTKSKNLPNSSTVKKMVPKKAREQRDFISSEH